MEFNTYFLLAAYKKEWKVDSLHSLPSMKRTVPRIDAAQGYAWNQMVNSNDYKQLKYEFDALPHAGPNELQNFEYNFSYGGGGFLENLKEKRRKQKEKRRKQKADEEKEEKEKEQRQEFAKNFLNKNWDDNWADEFTEEYINQRFRENLWKYGPNGKYDLTYLKYDDAESRIKEIWKTIEGLNIEQSLKNRFAQTLNDLWIHTKTKWQKRVIREAQYQETHQLDPGLDRFLPYAMKGMIERIFPKPTEEQEKKTLGKCKGPCMLHQPQTSLYDPSSDKCSCYTGTGLWGPLSNWEYCPKSRCQYKDGSKIYKTDIEATDSDAYYNDDDDDDIIAAIPVYADD